MPNNYKNGNEYYNKNIKTGEDGVMVNVEENEKKSEFKDYTILRKYLIENPKRSIEYDNKQEIRPSCVNRLDVLVKAYNDKPNTIEEWNYLIEQQIIIWRGGY